MPADSKTLIEKIEALPAERIAEIEDFVDFIRLREQERALTRGAAAARRGFCGDLEQSRGRRLRCPLSSAISSWCRFRSPARGPRRSGLRLWSATAPTAP